MCWLDLSALFDVPSKGRIVPVDHLHMHTRRTPSLLTSFDCLGAPVARRSWLAQR